MSKGDSVMPTKNSAKKVENNGYSKITSKAPDMENSTEVLFVPKPMKKKLTPHKPPAPKKPRVPKAKSIEAAIAEELIAVGEEIVEAKNEAEAVAFEREVTCEIAEKADFIESEPVAEPDEEPVEAEIEVEIFEMPNEYEAEKAAEAAEIEVAADKEPAVKSSVIGAISEETLEAVSPASERGAYVNLGREMPVHLL